VLDSTHTGPRGLLPVAPTAPVTACPAPSLAGLAVVGVNVPAGPESFPQVECALEPAYRRQRALTSPIPAALGWRAADRRFVLPHGESSASSPPV
jgi:hypothetical protein